MKLLLVSVIDQLKVKVNQHHSATATFTSASLVLALLQRLGISPVQDVTLSLLKMLVLRPNTETKQCEELQHLLTLAGKSKEFRYNMCLLLVHNTLLFCVEACW